MVQHIEYFLQFLLKVKEMSRYLPTLLRTCNQSTNKHYKLAAGLIRNGRLVSVSANKSSIHDHAERLAVKKYFERCKEQK